MTTYGVAHVIHLLCGIAFIGVVFVEVVLLEGLRKPLGAEAMANFEAALINRARRIMPWVVGTLFLSGLGLAWFHRAALASAPTSSMGTLLLVKMTLAFSVLGHFIYALKTAADGCMNSVLFKRLHISVGLHMLGIVLLAKGMFYVSW